MFNISEFIKINRVYFIWAVFGGMIYLFKDMFGLVFMTFIMCFVVSSLAHILRRKYRLNRRMVVVSFYVLFLIGVICFLKYIPPGVNSARQAPTEATVHPQVLKSARAPPPHLKAAAEFRGRLCRIRRFSFLAAFG